MKILSKLFGFIICIVSAVPSLAAASLKPMVNSFINSFHTKNYASSRRVDFTDFDAILRPRDFFKLRYDYEGSVSDGYALNTTSTALVLDIDIISNNNNNYPQFRIEQFIVDLKKGSLYFEKLNGSLVVREMYSVEVYIPKFSSISDNDYFREVYSGDSLRKEIREIFVEHVQGILFNLPGSQLEIDLSTIFTNTNNYCSGEINKTISYNTTLNEYYLKNVSYSYTSRNETSDKKITAYYPEISFRYRINNRWYWDDASLRYDKLVFSKFSHRFEYSQWFAPWDMPYELRSVFEGVFQDKFQSVKEEYYDSSSKFLNFLAEEEADEEY